MGDENDSGDSGVIGATCILRTRTNGAVTELTALSSQNEVPLFICLPLSLYLSMHQSINLPPLDRF